MALRAVVDHPKFFRLKTLLKLTKGECLGYLEAVWHFTGRYTPNGNIGKYSVEEIEAWVEWDGEEGALISAMITAKWIDNDPVHGLIVHDWCKHADDATRLSLKRANTAFIVPTVSGQCRDTVTDTATVSGLPEPEPVPEPVPEPEKNTDTRSEEDVLGGKSEEIENRRNLDSYQRHAIPTRDQVRAHAKTLGRDGLADEFFEFYESVGWQDAEFRPISNWRLMFKKFESRSSSPPPAQPATVQVLGLTEAELEMIHR